MPIFRVDDQNLRKLHIAPLGKERDLQRLLEANLVEALGVRFLASEYVTTMGGRIDTLGVDEAGSPVIIEYKKGRNDNVINQALSYLRWLKTQKKEFFQKLMIDTLGAAGDDRLALDWANPRVICIAESYSKFDIDTVEVVPLRIELLRYRFYSDDVFSLEPLNVKAEEGVELQAAPRTRRPDTKDGQARRESDATSLPEAQTSELSEALREWILGLDETVTEKITKSYVAYRYTKNFAEVHLTRNALKLYLRPLDYSDPHHLLEQVPASYNWTMDRRLYIRNADDLERAKPLIEQSFRDVL